MGWSALKFRYAKGFSLIGNLIASEYGFPASSEACPKSSYRGCSCSVDAIINSKASAADIAALPRLKSN